ncbi:hypothetical protein GCM10011342_29400 [Aquisalinus flavus]|uniref:TonB C-terminal domain-containing protein n=2 Tax=Aquisalinus flavus TaxID=1526572 RepID=A0A8J2V637_9PROT|nr:hypothetical protein GCM10011342_29400 [Aquisalinus flavus]
MRLYSVILASFLFLSPTFVSAQNDDGSFAYAYQAYMRAADNDDATAMARHAGEAFERAQEVLEADDIQLGYLAANYAEALVLDGKSSRAEPVFEDCIAILKDYFPQTVPDVTYCWDGLGWTYVNRSDPDEAKEAFESALTVAAMLPDDAELRKYRADTHLVAANIYMPPGLYYFRERLGELSLERTRYHAQQAVLLLPEFYGDGTLELAEAWMLLGHGMPQDERAEAAAAYGNAWRLYRELEGDDARATVAAYARFRGAANDVFRDEDAPDDEDPEYQCEYIQPDGTIITACIKKRTEPRFPSNVRDLDGIVVIELMYDVDENGTVQNQRVIFSNQDKFIPACQTAMRTWRYENPVNEEGEPVSIRDLTVTYKFQVVS